MDNLSIIEESEIEKSRTSRHSMSEFKQSRKDTNEPSYVLTSDKRSFSESDNIVI